MVKRALLSYRPVILVAIVGLPVVFAADWLLKQFELSVEMRWGFALLRMVPGTLLLVAMIHAARSQAEMQRRIFFEAAAIAFAITVLMTFVYGSLQSAGLYTATWDDIGNPMMLWWVVGFAISVWRYR